MGKLVESTFMALNGLITAPQEWSPPYWDDEHAAYATKLLSEADALLLGRRTYEGFVEAWPQRSGDPYSERINAMPKYVASRTLQETTWNTTLLGGDAAEEVARLKGGQNLLKFGTGEVDRTLDPGRSRRRAPRLGLPGACGRWRVAARRHRDDPSEARRDDALQVRHRRRTRTRPRSAG